MRFFCPILLASLTLTSTAQAGAWVQPKGHGLVIAQASYYTTEHYFDSNGAMQHQPRFSKYELQPYGEYGLLDWLTVGGSAYAQSVTQSGATNRGIADPELFARARLWSNARQVISLQPLIKFTSQFQKDTTPRGGSQSTDAELSLLYGRNLTLISPHDYVDIRTGYRLRNNSLGNQLRTDIALGLQVADRVQIVPALRSIMATSMTDIATYREDGDLDYNMVKAEVTGLYHLNDTQWLQAGVFKHVMGVQTGNGYGVSIGFAQDF